MAPLALCARVRALFSTNRTREAELDRSRSELTVSDWVLRWTPQVFRYVRNHHSYKCGMADATTSQVRARQVGLRQSGHREGATPVNGKA